LPPDLKSITADVVAPSVIATYPHDASAFTQGLLFHNGKLYESTGRYEHSTLREVDIKSGIISRSIQLEDSFFAEGLARINDQLYQLTWQKGQAFVYDLKTFTKVKTFQYEVDGWGLCSDGTNLYMSDGSAALYQRNPDTFKIENTLQVKSGESPINCLNELECVGDSIYANVLGSNFIVKIDKNTGRTVGAIDASSLLPKSNAEAYGVLNGIAHDPETGSFYLIGKIGQRFLKSENRKIVARESLFETVFHDSR
jgi:glutamine cyclotransferase